MTQFLLVRWMPTRDEHNLCDGIDSLYDLIHAPYVFVATSIADAKKIVEDLVLNDELLPFDIPEELRNSATNADLSWDDEHIPQYAVVFRGDPIVALVYIEPLREFYQKATGGPE